LLKKKKGIFLVSRFQTLENDKALIQELKNLSDSKVFKETKINNCILQVCQGDITNEKVDAM
jgi:hypothetical protein